MPTITYQQDIFDRFKKTFEEDKKEFIEDWMVSWDYQDVRNKRQVKYKGELPEDFYRYDGPKDIYQWMNWQLGVEKKDYFDPETVSRLTQKSRDYDQRLIDLYKIGLDFTNYDNCIGSNNAQDFILANLYPHPAEGDPPKVLDFGAGYGRQANLWTQEKKEMVYVAMDAIPKSYCLQHLYFSNSDCYVQDYVLDKLSFNLDEDSKGIYHLPTWRYDLLPDNFFDKIVVVQVLQELNGKLVRKMLEVFHRILKPSGAIYLRDHDQAWRPTHKLNVNKVLEETGFTLEYRAHIVDKEDLHGIPRIWRKTNPRVVEQEQIGIDQRMKELSLKIDEATGGKVKSIAKKIIKRTQ